MTPAARHNFRLVRDRVRAMPKPERQAFYLMVRLGPLNWFVGAVLAELVKMPPAAAGDV